MIEEVKSWRVLTAEEQSVLALAMGHSKSSWEGGEIMGKAHYKYLEILQRAQRFVMMFEEHLSKYDDLFAEELLPLLPKDFKEFFQNAVMARKTIKEAIIAMSNEKNIYRVRILRDTAIATGLSILFKSKLQSAQDAFTLIREFDRYNNFRILPVEWQLPSGFKRRNKNRQLKYLKGVSNMSEVSYILFEQKYKYVGKHKTLYVPMIYQKRDDFLQAIIPIRDKISYRDIVTTLGFFIFADESSALKFVNLVYNYLHQPKSPGKGQKFWAEFRTIISMSENYLEVDRIIPYKKLLNARFQKQGLMG